MCTRNGGDSADESPPNCTENFTTKALLTVRGRGGWGDSRLSPAPNNSTWGNNDTLGNVERDKINYCADKSPPSTVQDENNGNEEKAGDAPEAAGRNAAAEAAQAAAGAEKEPKLDEVIGGGTTQISTQL